MKKHLDVFLPIVAIIAVGDAASLLGQSPVQQQLGIGRLGGGPLGAMDSVFSGGSGGNLGESRGSSLGPLPGGLLGGGGGQGIDGSRRPDFSGGVGGGSGAPSLPGPFGGNTAEGPFGRGVGAPTGALGQSGQPQGVNELGGNLPGVMDRVLSGGVRGGPGGNLGLTDGTVPGGVAGAGRVGPTAASSGGVLGNDFGGANGGPFGGRSAGGSALDRGVGGPTGSGSGTGLLGSGSGAGPGRGGLALSPSLDGNGPLSPGGSRGGGVAGGPFSSTSLSSGPVPTVGSETSLGSPLSDLPGGVTGPALSSSLGSGGPMSPEGTQGSGAASGLLSTPSRHSRPGSLFGSGSGPASSLPGVPGSISGRGSVRSPFGENPSTSGSIRPGGAISSAGSIIAGLGARRGSERAESRLRGGNLLGRRLSSHGHRGGKLSPERAAAIGLGAAGTALALGAIAATIASAVQQRQRLAKQGGTGTGCVGCRRTPCIGNCGRQRRSIAKSKVPAEILDSIPVNFERLY